MTEEIHFFTGKGGTGKSLAAAGLALREAKKGRQTLLVELGERSFYKDFFGLPEVRYRPTRLADNLDVALWTGTECLHEYARHLIKVESLTRLFFENSVSRSLINIAPGLTELAVLGKATSGPRKHGPQDPHRVIVIDAFATGHFLALLKAPLGMAEAVSFGPMGEQSRSIDRVLHDRSLCRYHVVTLPEEMPVKETEELVASLRSEIGLEPDIVLNKMVPVPDGVPSSPHPFVHFLGETSRRQAEMKARLERLGTPIVEIPQFFTDDPRELQAAAAEALS